MLTITALHKPGTYIFIYKTEWTRQRPEKNLYCPNANGTNNSNCAEVHVVLSRTCPKMDLY